MATPTRTAKTFTDTSLAAEVAATEAVRLDAEAGGVRSNSAADRVEASEDSATAHAQATAPFVDPRDGLTYANGSKGYAGLAATDRQTTETARADAVKVRSSPPGTVLSDGAVLAEGGVVEVGADYLDPLNPGSIPAVGNGVLQDIEDKAADYLNPVVAGSIPAVGDAQVQSVTAEGDAQLSRVTTEGDAQFSRVETEGDAQVQRATTEADRSTAEAARSTAAAADAADDALLVYNAVATAQGLQAVDGLYLSEAEFLGATVDGDRALVFDPAAGTWRAAENAAGSATYADDAALTAVAALTRLALGDTAVAERTLTNLGAVGLQSRRVRRARHYLMGATNADDRADAMRQMLADQAADPNGEPVVFDGYADGSTVEIAKNLTIDHPDARLVVEGSAALRVATGAQLDGGFISSQSGIRNTSVFAVGPTAHRFRAHVEGAAIDANSGPNETGAANAEKTVTSVFRLLGSHLDPLRDLAVTGHVEGVGMHSVVSGANIFGLTLGRLASRSGSTGSEGEGGGVLGLTGVQQWTAEALIGVGLGELLDLNHDCLHGVVLYAYAQDLIGEGEMFDINNSGYLTVLEAHAVDCKKPLGAYNNTEHLETVPIDARDYGHIKIPNFLVEYTRDPASALSATMIAMSTVYGRGSEIGLTMRAEGADGPLTPALFDVPFVNIDCDRLDVEVNSEIVPPGYGYLVRNNLAESVTRARVTAPLSDGMAALEVAGDRAVALQPRVVNTSGTSTGRVGVRLEGRHSTVVGPREGMTGVPVEGRVTRRAIAGYNTALVPGPAFVREPDPLTLGDGELYHVGGVTFVKPPGKTPRPLAYAGGGVVALDVPTVSRSSNTSSTAQEFAVNFNNGGDGTNTVNRDGVTGVERFRAAASGTTIVTLTGHVLISSASGGAAGDTRRVRLYRVREAGVEVTPTLLKEVATTAYDVAFTFEDVVMQSLDEVELRVALPDSAAGSTTILATNGALTTECAFSGLVFE